MKKSTLFLLALLSLITINISLGQSIVINEMQSSNANTIADNNGNYSDWIELYNKSTTVVSLLGYGLSDNALIPLKWVFPNVTIGPNQYLLVWASGKDVAVPGSPLHTNFKISASGNPISLADPTGKILDNIPAVVLISDISYGRLPNGTGNFVYFGTPTPDAVNSSVGYTEFLNPPTFSVSSGFFTQGFALTISSSDTGATIFYTLDGSEPDPNNLLGTTYTYKNQYPQNPGQAPGPFLQQSFKTLQYSAPITISDRSSSPNKIASISTTFDFNPTYIPSDPIYKGTVVRAKVVKTGALTSSTVTKSYFISPLANNLYSVPVVSLSLTESDFFDYNNGIYVAGVDFDNWRKANPTTDSADLEGPGTANFSRNGKATEKVANMTYFVKGIEQFNQGVGVQIHGLSSRDFPSKSLNIYPRGKYGDTTIKYPIFSDRPFDNTFNSIVLRNSGNDFNQTMFRDALCQELMESLNVITQRDQPTITFVNGEYWGILDLRDKIDADYLNKDYNVSTKEIDYLENDGTYILNGDNVNYTALQDYLNNNTLATQDNYNYVITQIDPDSFKDYFISNIFFNNVDWPGNNIYYWRKKTASYIPNAPYGQDGRWRWIAHDMDATFAIYTGGSYNTNSLAAATDPNGPESPNPAWSTLMLRRMLENNTFKIDFINRFADLLNTSFNSNRVISKINDMKAVIAPEMPGQYARWKMPVSDSDWNYYLNLETTYAQNRPDAQRTHIRAQFGISSNLTATLNVSDPTQGYIKMNTIDILPTTPGVPANPYPWTGIYFNNIPVTLKAVPLPGYAFSNWSGDSTSTSNEITLTPTGNFSLTAHFVPDSSTGVSEIIYFWMMDINITDNIPLTSINSTFGLSSTATLEYQSCLTGYPFTNSSSNWRKASMERRNSPTSLNYFQQYNGNLPFISSNMKGLQVKQPFQNGTLQNTMILDIPTQNFKNIKLDFAVMDEGAATGISIDYSSNAGTPVWTTAGMTTSSFPITESYQVIESDFTTISSVNNNPNFKIRFRFTGPNMSTDVGKQVTFNNISVQGIPTAPLSINENSISNFIIYPNPVKSTLNISSNYDSIQYRIFSVDGKMINKGSLNSTELNVSYLPAGMYLLQLNAEGKTEVKKFIKN